MRRRARVARGLVLVATSVVVSIAGACADAPAEPPPIPLPERQPSNEAGDGAGIHDAPAVDVDVGIADGAPDACGNARVCSGNVGCSDGTREGFAPIATYENIAACAGAWSVAGLLAPTTKTPACLRAAGNDGVNPSGAGCSVADLCEVGWHVCESAPEVAAKSGAAGCAGAATAGSFFVTRQSGAGNAQCGGGANDLFGCGALGMAPDPITCAPLDRFSGDLCASVGGGWACGADNVQEANNVTHTTSTDGGVLCCRD